MRIWFLGYYITIVLTAFSPVRCAQAAGRRPSAHGQIRVTSEPEGALVEWNGIPRQNTPTTLTAIDPGAHLLKLSKDGYRETKRTVHLLPGQRSSMNITLEPVNLLVLVHATPANAEVTVDGALRGRTPLLIPDFPLGRHRLEISAEGHLPRLIDLNVDDRVPRKVDVTLLSDSATLVVRSQPEGADVLVNGIPKGATPSQIEDIPTGTTRVEIRHEGHRPYAETIRLEAGMSFSIDARLEPIPGLLRVRSIPEGASVYLDHRYRGETPLTLEELPDGAYRVRVERLGYEPDARNVTVRGASETVEEFRLVRNSGTLVLVTEPPDVEVFINGEARGTTRPGPGPAVSEPLRIEYLSRGEHTLQLTRPGYQHPPRRIRIEPDKIVTLHERMTRLFIPDTLIRTRDGRELRGQVLRTYENGDIEFETRHGVIHHLEEEEILTRRPLEDP